MAVGLGDVGAERGVARHFVLGVRGAAVEPHPILDDRAADVAKRADVGPLVIRVEQARFRDVRVEWIETYERPPVAVKRVGLIVGADLALVAVGARPGQDADDAAGGAAELGVVARRLDLHLVDEIEQHRLSRRAVLQVRRVHAVDDEAILGSGGAIDLRAAGLAFLLRARRLPQDGGEVASLGHAVDRFLRHRGRGRVSFRVDERRGFSRDRHGFGHAGEREDEVDREVLAELEHDLGRSPGLETLKGRRDLVGSRRQRGEAIDARGVGRDRRHGTGRRTFCVDSCAREHRALSVLDDSLNRAGLFLC